MRFSDKAIVLQNIRHGDKRHILRLYTRRHGLLTAITTVGKSPKAKVRASTIMPLSIISAELVVKQNKEIQQLTEAAPALVLDNIHHSLSKLGIAQFINEILIKSLKEQHENQALFDLIESSLVYLNDAERDFVNLHLYFLLELSKHLGFEPQNNFSAQTPFFDCREGCFSAISLTYPLGLTQSESQAFSTFLRANVLTSPIGREQRYVLLDILLACYRLHVPSFNDIRSLEVLKEVMAN
jgi:DNA repair protein RecO (recombination protein O)